MSIRLSLKKIFYARYVLKLNFNFRKNLKCCEYYLLIANIYL